METTAGAVGLDDCARLFALDLASLPGEQAVEAMRLAFRVSTWAAAMFDRALYEGCRAVEGSTERAELDRHSSLEAAAEFGWSVTMADRRLAQAAELIEDFPAAARAMAAGVLEPRKAQVFTDVCQEMTPEHRDATVAEVLPEAPELPVKALADRLTEVAEALDPDWSAVRLAAALGRARVTHRRNPSGSGELAGRDLPLDDAIRARGHLDAVAHAVHVELRDRGLTPPRRDWVRARVLCRLTDGSVTGLDDDAVVAAIIAEIVEELPGDDEGPDEGGGPDLGPEGGDAGGPDDGPDDGPSGGPGDGPGDPPGGGPGDPPGGGPGDPPGGGPGDPPGGGPSGGPSGGPGDPPGDPPGGGPGDPPGGGPGEPPGGGPGEPPGGGPAGGPSGGPSDGRPGGPEGGPAPGAPGEGPAGPEPDPEPPDPEPPLVPGSRLRQGIVEVRLRLSTLLGLDQLPGHVPTWGTVGADQARSLALARTGGEWRAVLCHPDGRLRTVALLRRRPAHAPRHRRDGRDHTAIVELAITTDELAALDPDAHGPFAAMLREAQHAMATAPDPADPRHPASSRADAHRRHPGAELDRYLRVRDRRCIGPACHHPAATAQIDHTRDWITGGPTTAPNTGVPCTRHHDAKTDRRWQLVQPDPGHFRWRSPAGVTHDVRPRPVINPVPAPLRPPEARRPVPPLDDEELDEPTSPPPSPARPRTTRPRRRTMRDLLAGRAPPTVSDVGQPPPF